MKPYQNTHKGDDEVDGPMGPDHDHVAICDTGIVQVPSERVGGFVDLAVCKSPLGSGGRLGLDNTGSVGVSFGVGAEVLLDGAYIAGPVQVNCGIR